MQEDEQNVSESAGKPAPVPVSQRCEVCGSLLDEEDLFCSNCGTEAPRRSRQQARHATEEMLGFSCQGCGASMSYSARDEALRCPFCGSVELLQRPRQRILAPEAVVPFRIGHAQAQQILQRWLAQGFWRPSDLTQQAQLVKITPVYVPYWVFRARTHTYWTADSSATPPGARANWYPVFGEHQGEYESLLVGASGVLADEEIASLVPFELSQAVPPDQVDYTHTVVEQFALPRRHARPLARSLLESLELEACGRLVPGSHRNLHVNVLVTQMSSRPVLLPVWVMAYRYRDKVYRFLVNGQTGKATGTAPISWFKVTMAVLITALVAVVLGGIALLASQ